MTMRILSSKAPAPLLARLVTELGAEPAAQGGADDVVADAAGGVDVEQQVASGAGVDVVVLASGAIERLAAQGHVLPEPQELVLATEAVVAVADGSSRMAGADGADLPDVSTPEALRAAVERARAVGISTGPSGDAVRRILDAWGLADRTVVAPPGVPVGSMLADGTADLVVQQRTELEGMTGVAVVGPLPGDLALTSRFVGAVVSASDQPEAAAAVLAGIARLARSCD